MTICSSDKKCKEESESERTKTIRSKGKRVRDKRKRTIERESETGKANKVREKGEKNKERLIETKKTHEETKIRFVACHNVKIIMKFFVSVFTNIRQCGNIQKTRNIIFFRHRRDRMN